MMTSDRNISNHPTIAQTVAMCTDGPSGKTAQPGRWTANCLFLFALMSGCGNSGAGAPSAAITSNGGSSKAGPSIAFSTFLGQTGADIASAMAIDGQGNIFVTGSVRNSPNPAQNDDDENTDVFVAMVSADGTQLNYLTVIGGSEDDFAGDVCVDQAGNAYVIGSTQSLDFPVTSAPQQNFAGRVDAFLVQLDSAGSPVFASYIGGQNNDEGKGIFCDGAGYVYLTGQTNSPDFPLQGALQADLNPTDGDAFVMKIGMPGYSVMYSTYLGGRLLDTGKAITSDGSGNAYVIGTTDSGDFPLVNSLQPNKGGESPSSPDAFVAKISADGARLLYSTFLGGRLADDGSGIAVDVNGNAYVIGSTFSTDFPMANSGLSSHRGKLDAFVARLSADGSALDFSVLLGGGQSDTGKDIAMDSAGNIVITGSTESADFPVFSSLQGHHAGGARDTFIAKLSSDDGELLFSSFFGGGLFDEGVEIGAYGKDEIYFVGRTNSGTLPVINALQASYGGGSFDPFLVKVLLDECNNPSASGPTKCK
jgi:hypothetical protein